MLKLCVVGKICVIIWDHMAKRVPNGQSDSKFPILNVDTQVNKCLGHSFAGESEKGFGDLHRVA